jgi:hypothetical protein
MNSPFINPLVAVDAASKNRKPYSIPEWQTPFLDVARESSDEEFSTDQFEDEAFYETGTWNELEAAFEEFDIRKDASTTKLADKIGKHFGVSAKLISEYDWVFNRKWGDKFKQLVKWAAAEVNLNPGLVAVNLIAETSATDYLGGEISSFTIGVDDFYDKRKDVQQKVPAYSKISWHRPAGLTDVNERGRTVNSVILKSGKDAALASAVYLKHGEEVLRQEASALKKNFDDIPLETRFALVRLGFNAGLGRAKKNLKAFLLNDEAVLILKPQKKAGPQRKATIRAAMAIYLSEVAFANPLNLVENESYEATGWAQFEDEVKPVNTPVCSIDSAIKNKIGFEFDMLLSITSDIKKSRTLAENTIVSEHTQASDHFELKIDGNKIEVSTKPFELSASGLTELKEGFENITKWLADLNESFDTYKKEIDHPICAGCLAGKGYYISTKDAGKKLKIKDAFITAEEHFIFPLKTAVSNRNDYYSKSLTIKGVPQATLGIPLSQVNALVNKIRETENERVGVGLSRSGSKVRLGLRSDALFNAQERVTVARQFFLRSGELNALKITHANFSDALTGFLILVVQYLWTSVLPIDDADPEGYSKAYIPLHSKTRFRDMYHCLLSKEEQELFLKIFWEGNNWKNLFSLTKKIRSRPGGYVTIEDTPDIRLFPSTMVDTEPTWKEFITSIVENNFDVEKASGDSTLVSNPAKAILLKNNGVVLELRRMAYGTSSSDKWLDMATRLFSMADALNK